MLQLDTQGKRPLDEIRKALKRADNILKALKNPGELPKTQNGIAEEEELAVDVPALAAEVTPEKVVNEGPTRKSAERKTRLTRPRSLRLIKFPTGEMVAAEVVEGP
jgi:hypothetical protein